MKIDHIGKMVPQKISPPPLPRRIWPGATCPVPLTEANRIIGIDQIYDLNSVKDLVRQHGIVVLNNDTVDAMGGKGRSPLPSPDWTYEELAGVILALTNDDYENSQWCALNVNKYLDCDSYLIYYSRSRKARWDTITSKGLKLYVKFGFIPMVSIPKAVVCRLHLANY